MASTTTIPIATIQSYHAKVRQLYARMVLTLSMDPKQSMEITAFWLWLEERSHMDVINGINSLDDYILHVIATLGQTFIETLHHEIPSNHPSYYFHREAVNGIAYYLDRVCYRVLEDIRRRAEAEARLCNQMEALVHQMSLTSLENSMNTRQDRPVTYVPHGEGTSRGSVGERRAKSIPSIVEVEKEILSGYPFNLPMIRMMVGPSQQYYQHQQVPYAQGSIPKEERTLFVTFSNGYPLTEDELYNFFMRHYGDVETVILQKTKGKKNPLFAHVSFYSFATVHRVLNGNVKVKFMIRGKHLWARRYYPKGNEDNKDK